MKRKILAWLVRQKVQMINFKVATPKTTVARKYRNAYKPYSTLYPMKNNKKKNIEYCNCSISLSNPCVFCNKKIKPIKQK